MKKKITFYIITLFTLLTCNEIFSQDYVLEITSKNDKEKSVLKEIKYTTHHKDTNSLNNEIKIISNILKNKGYFTNLVRTIKKKDKRSIAYFSLQNKITEAVLKIEPDQANLFSEYNIKEDTLIIPINKLKKLLSKITLKLDQQGKSFSKIRLQNISIKNEILFAELKISQSTKRNIQKVIIKGYEEFSKSYIKNYFNISPNTLFNQQKINQISSLTKNLNFIKEIKEPEVLFTKDSTILYMYLKKVQTNNFDGILNLSSKENGDIIFNGNINLELINTLNKGEEFNIFWNSIGEDTQELKLFTKTPYIFNSKISPEVSFSIYKQDSSYINSKIETQINYNLNNYIKLGLNYNSESSSTLTSENTLTNQESFTNSFIGINFSYAKPKNDSFFNNKLYLELTPFLGHRKANHIFSSQIKIKTKASYIWDINSRNNVYIKNEFGYLLSDNYLNNELFRIGGANSIRGYTEQSIFTKNYNFFNLEYRHLTSDKSYIYSISDIGTAKINKTNTTLIGLGFGYLFTTNNSQINISTIGSKSNSKTIDFKNIKLLIGWKNFF
ncbi:POTRA domain-containing protein [Polaribacter sargassicola]|uniref:POTRA domain-containing protein n=1 Tax=Polaribacter sargassicola TaxID=2836891 RepID=UPI001F3D5AE3|nr:POTRA domain-containing protein [Polaribacter sp. DS7-9]MCG1035699.1 hypothetical protein [Polaribacter sp. DS7-9]